MRRNKSLLANSHFSSIIIKTYDLLKLEDDISFYFTLRSFLLEGGRGGAGKAFPKDNLVGFLPYFHWID